jgi:hypothetical protein
MVIQKAPSYEGAFFTSTPIYIGAARFEKVLNNCFSNFLKYSIKM